MHYQHEHKRRAHCCYLLGFARYNCKTADSDECCASDRHSSLFCCFPTCTCSRKGGSAAAAPIAFSFSAGQPISPAQPTIRVCARQFGAKTRW